ANPITPPTTPKKSRRRMTSPGVLFREFNRTTSKLGRCWADGNEPPCSSLPDKRDHPEPSRRPLPGSEWSDNNEPNHEKRSKRPPCRGRRHFRPVLQCPGSDSAARFAALI